MARELNRNQITLLRLREGMQELGSLVEQLSGMLKYLQQDVDDEIFIRIQPHKEVENAPQVAGAVTTAPAPTSGQLKLQADYTRTYQQKLAREVGDPASTRRICNWRRCTARAEGYVHPTRAQPGAIAGTGEALCQTHLERFKQLKSGKKPSVPDIDRPWLREGLRSIGSNYRDFD